MEKEMVQEEDVLTESKILEDFGLSKNEIRTYLTILSIDLCEAKDICTQTHIPSSKIYNILENLAKYGLIEIQESRPKKYKPVGLDLALENLRKLKRKEYETFKAKIPKLETFLQRRLTNYDTDSLFWNVTVNESEIFNKHVSRFRFVEFVSMICIDFNMLNKMTGNSKMAQEISLNFKKKKIDTKLIIGYDTDKQKVKILQWIHRRPRKLNAKNQIRLLKEKVSVPFGLFDLNKVILLMRHPIKPNEFLLSIYMVNKSLYEDLIPYFDDIWNRAEAVYLEEDVN